MSPLWDGDPPDEPATKVQISLDDIETRETYESAQQAREEVSSWPAWKRGDLVPDFGRNEMPPELAAQILEREATLPGPEGITTPIREFLDLHKEECAESIHRASKAGRFGLRVNPYNGTHNRETLEDEMGDVLATIRTLAQLGAVDMRRVFLRAEAKQAAYRVNDGRVSEPTRQALLAADTRITPYFAPRPGCCTPQLCYQCGPDCGGRSA